MLTPEGQALAARAQAVFALAMDCALNGFSEDELRCLDDMLRRIVANGAHAAD